MKKLIFIPVATLITYLFASFYSLSWNFATWSIDCRGVCIGILAAAIFFFFVFVAVYSDIIKPDEDA